MYDTASVGCGVQSWVWVKSGPTRGQGECLTKEKTGARQEPGPSLREDSWQGGHPHPCVILT